MGSCENLAIIEKPLCGSVIEQNLSLDFSLPSSISDQRSCSEVSFSLFDSKVDPTNALNRCLNFSKVDDTGCTSSSEVTDYAEAVTVDKDGLMAECQNVSNLMLEKVPGSVCRTGRDCLNEIQSKDDACKLGTGALCLEKRESQGEYDRNTSLESFQMIVLLGNCVQPDMVNDKSISSSSPEGVKEVGDEKSVVIVGLETDSHNQTSSLQCFEMPLELVTMTGLPSDSGQQQDQENIKSTGDLSLEVVDGRTDCSAGTEADVHNLISPPISPLEGGEMPLKVLHAGDLLSNYEESDQKDDNTVHSPSEEQANGRALENLHVSESLDIPAEKNEWQNGNDIDSTCAERVSKLVEDKSDITTVTSVEPGAANVAHNYSFEKSVSPESYQHFSNANSNIPAEKNEWQNGNDIDSTCAERVSKLVEEKSDITTVTSVEPSAANVPHNYSFEKSVSPESCQHISNASSNTSKGMPDENIITSINSSSVAECSEHTDNEEKDNMGVGCVYEIKCPEIVSLSSQSNGRRSKSSQKTSKKRAKKKCKNTTHVLHSHGSIRIVSKAAQMKRSSFSKPARSSIWGSLENITKFFGQSNGIYGFSQVHNQGGRKARGGRRSGKQNKMQASGSSQGSRGNRCVSSSLVRLKVKIGKVAGQSCLKNLDPKFFDASASANTAISDCGTDLFSGSGLELLKFDNGLEDSSREYGQLTNKDSENTNNIGKAAGDADDCLGFPSNVVVDTLGGPIENRCTDSGTSPDSEVINLTPDTQVSAIHQPDLQDTLLTSSKDVSARGHHASSKRGKKNKLPRSRNCILEDGSPGLVSKSKSKSSKKQGCRQLVGNGICSRETLTSLTNLNSSRNSSSNKEFSVEPLVFSRETEHGILGETLKEESSVEAKTYSNLCADVELSESHNSKILHPSMKAMGCKLSKSGKVRKGRSKASESEGKRGNSRRQKREKQSRSVNKCKVKEKDTCNQIVHIVESHPETGSYVVDGIEKTNADDDTAVTDESNLNMVLGGLENQYPPPRKAWVLCDECHKWRRIPAMLADLIDKTNRTWTCKDNMDIAFADCSIPQEKSNSQINDELDISDASGEEDVNDARLNYKGLECGRSTGYQESTFKCISNNEFLHRKRKTQTIDEIMVCHCKSASNDQLGCGDECLNRMLNIECVQGTCPCGDFCSNQQFQKQKYAKLEWFRSGKKGYGLKLLEDISKGHFLIEYVGEVLDMHAYEARQKEYALKGHRHFYFMTLNGSEVIDACAKGNLGRFINHSCDPNCRTEKWMVNGEICIGLFALRDIKKGEEVTFDYNYVRVFGAAAKKCYCDAPQCRGYIGGDLHNSEVIVQGDSDEEFPEPVMLLKDGEHGDSVDDMMPTASPPFDFAEIQAAKSTIKSRHGIDKCTTGGRHVESAVEKEDPINQSLMVGIPRQTDDVTSKSLPAVRKETSIEEETMNKTSSNANRLEIVSPTYLAHGNSLSDVTNSSMKSKSDTVEDKRVSSKSQSQMRISRSSSSVKKGKASSNPLNTSKVQVTANKSQPLPSKSKRSLANSPNGRSEAVEEKLNELLDTEGGISKRKDAPKGYLKLLLLTAASGDGGNGEAIQSNRDLSMILDALLKTKSRTVLIDIINKNGLQMLHNIMKQYRRDFKKIPILRKLLKVLEYLAVREILTTEHINGGPPCPGMESFRESILSLTEHDDKQVHQIARNFRDKWIPRPVRKLSHVDRDNGRMEIRRGSNCDRFSLSHNYWRDQEDARPTEAIDCVKQSMVAMTSYDTGIPEDCSAPCIGSCLTSETKTRKRKSRWDQPAETNQDSRSQHKDQKIDSTSLHKFESGPLQRGIEEAQDPIDTVSRKKGNCAGSVHNHSQQDRAISADNERQNILEDIPPGFSSPQALGVSLASSAATDLLQHNVCDMKPPLDAVIGQPQGKFISHLPVSYGMPLSIVQHFGTPLAESIDGWFIAPGMPFHPFPPLPSYPRDSKNCPPSHAPNHMTINQPAEGLRDSHCRTPCHTDETPKYLDGPCANGDQPFKRARESSYDLGRRYFRQEKWNATKVGPPGLQKRNVWGHVGDDSRDVSCSIGIGKVANEATNSYLSEELSCRVERAGNNFYQHSQHQNHH